MMDLKTYTRKARETALPTAYAYAYLVPGLISEIGECYGVEAKASRDLLSDGEREARAIGEWGDVAWVTALMIYHTEALLEARGVSCREAPPVLEEGERDYGAPLPTMMAAALDIASAIDEPDRLSDIRVRAYQIWRFLGFHARAFTGESWDKVLTYNLDKLASRAARAVLGGDGDNR